MAELLHKELSYQVVGILYKVYNALGSGLQEKYYQKAIARILKNEGICYLEQVRAELEVDDLIIGRYYLDFVIDNKIVLEIKSKSFFSTRDVRQVLGYLKRSGIELGILAAFSSEGLKVKRILRGYHKK
ncbi:MAG: GxxExxY protein [Candidatus Saganbacteria bacterium]|nr:GxxExxY protein [Candidatus Saganbacteria bacterium]